jgi:protease PrsW
MLSLSLAVTPIFIIIVFVYFQDKYSREPTLTLFIAFILGIVSVLPAMLIESIYTLIFNFNSGINLPTTILYSFFGVGLTEELSKFLFLRWYIYKNKNFSEPMDGVVYAVMVSMGFAAIENVLYVIMSSDPIFTAISRSLSAVPAHACFGVIMGLYFGLSRFTYSGKRFRYHLLSVALATLAHGFYNLFLFIGCKYCPLLTLLVLIICVIISLKIISRFKKISPFKKRITFSLKHKRKLSPEEIQHNEIRKQELRKKLFRHKKKDIKPDDTFFREDS